MTVINLLNSKVFCSEGGIFNLELVDGTLKVLNTLYMLHICAGNQRVVTQMAQRLTDCSRMFWPKLLLCICGRGDKINMEVCINTSVVLLLLYYL